MPKIIDSYEQFMQTFDIEKEKLYEFGINNTILPPMELVVQQWEDLKSRIYNNGIVAIRGYGRDAKGTELYTNLYKHLFNNDNVKKDATNNLEPQKIISKLTGYKRNENLFNYQVSHIFGKTKNIFLFEAPWNIALVPKIIDPFTGHETKGIWPIEYQQKFYKYAHAIYADFITEYNQIVEDPKLINGIKKYIEKLKELDGATREILQFEKDVLNEISTIRMENLLISREQTDTRQRFIANKEQFIKTEAELDYDEAYRILLDLKHSKNRSWVQLRNGCMDLLGELVVFTTQPMKNTSRAFARESQRVTGLSFSDILVILEERKLGLK